VHHVKYLALDLGKSRTGVAFCDSDIGVPVALDTIEHRSRKELLTRVRTIVAERRIDSLVVGLPLLPSGEEGEQATWVRSCAEDLQKIGLPLDFVDERYSTPQTRHRLSKNEAISGGSLDGDAAAACGILQTHLGC